ncbi:MAG: hypothetical protein ACYC1T_10980 [Sulfuricaulis sp.]
MEPENYFTTAAKLMEFVNSTETGVAHRTAGARLLRLGCRALRDLQRDMGIDGDIDWARHHLAEMTNLDRQLEQYEDSSRALFDIFLTAESAMFEKIGMPPDLRGFIIQRAGDLKREYWNLEEIPENTWNRMRQEVQALADNVCTYADSFATLEKWRDIGKRSALVLVGGSIIKINASIDAITTYGLAPWMTAKSGKLGSWFIKMGTHESEQK